MGEVGWCDSSTPVKIGILRIYTLPVEKLGLCASSMRLLILAGGRIQLKSQDRAWWVSGVTVEIDAEGPYPLICIGIAGLQNKPTNR